MNRIVLMFSVFCLIVLLTASSPGQSSVVGYHIVDSLKLGGEGGWDYLTVDPGAQRLYISRGLRVQVVDVVKNVLVGEIPETPGVHGIALAPGEGKGYTSNGRDSSVTVFDLSTLKTLAKIKIDARNPDAILYDPISQRVFTFNGGTSNATAIDAKTNTVIGYVALSGRPEFAVSDGRGHIYVNIEDKSVITEFDALSLKVLNTWSLAPGEEPSGLSIDQDHRRLFAGCSNRLMVVLNALSGKVVTTVPIGEGVDATAYDAGTGFAFSSNGEGTLTVVHEDSPEKYTVLENAVTRRGARTMAVDGKTHRVYTVSAKFGPPPPPTADRPHPRPTMEPGSATLYILSR